MSCGCCDAAFGKSHDSLLVAVVLCFLFISAVRLFASGVFGMLLLVCMERPRHRQRSELLPVESRTKAPTNDLI